MGESGSIHVINHAEWLLGPTGTLGISSDLVLLCCEMVDVHVDVFVEHVHC